MLQHLVLEPEDTEALAKPEGTCLALGATSVLVLLAGASPWDRQASSRV